MNHHAMKKSATFELRRKLRFVCFAFALPIIGIATPQSAGPQGSHTGQGEGSAKRGGRSIDNQAIPGKSRVDSPQLGVGTGATCFSLGLRLSEKVFQHSNP
jgi:hypothetical protein